MFTFLFAKMKNSELCLKVYLINLTVRLKV